MSYQVLARKWRPRNFQQMVGQEHVLRMLTNALNQQRIHHAYLFTGTRGVGKTTLARILAKCLNCETGITANPCGECNHCQSIDAGRFLDLIEIDAASRTKVEDTREILDNVQYAPAQGRMKIYLIDEVHMLSGHSFNALLKTLEEPPAHVKFLLATTDPKRLPITILSRCLQFNLKRVPREQISQHLQHICHTENISYDIAALDLLAEAADGSLRDALSLLDQTIAFCGNTINVSDTRHMLGSIDQDAIYRMLTSLAEHNGQQLLAEIAQLADFAPDFSQVLDDLITVLHQMSVTQIIPEYNCSEQIKLLANRFSAEEIQLYYQIALIGRRDLSLAPLPTQGFEMVMLRMLAFQPQIPDKPMATTHKKVTPEPIIKTPELQQWSDILSQLKLSGLAQTLAANCTLKNRTENQITLALSKVHAPLVNKKLTERIEQSLSLYFNKSITLDIIIIESEIESPAKLQLQEKTLRQNQAVASLQNNGTVQKIMDVFDATLDTKSIQSIDS